MLIEELSVLNIIQKHNNHNKYPIKYSYLTGKIEYLIAVIRLIQTNPTNLIPQYQ